MQSAIKDKEQKSNRQDGLLISEEFHAKSDNGIPSGVLTFEEIKEITGNGWAIIKNAEFNGCIFIRGELLFHSTDPDEAYDKLKHMKEYVFFLHCTERDPNVVYVL